jgi:translation initiation factor 1A
MGKNTIGGKKHKRAKNNNTDFKRPLQKKEDNECYAKVINVLGGCRLTCQCYLEDPKTKEPYMKEMIGVIRGNMRKRVWITKDDIILASLRGFQDNKCDVIWKFTSDEVRELQEDKELPSIMCKTNHLGENLGNILFGDKIESESESEEEEEQPTTVDYNKFNKPDSDEDLDNI